MKKFHQPCELSKAHKLQTGHKKPVTRRELIAQGYLGAAGYILGPSILSLLFEQLAYGACPTPSAVGKIPVFIFDCAGGAGLAKMMPPGAENGTPLPVGSLASVGISAAIDPVNFTNFDYGVGLHSTGALFRGLQNTIGTDANAAKYKMGIDGYKLCVASDNDTQNNPHNISHAIAKFAGAGELLTNIDGSGGSAAGSNSQILTGSAQASLNAVSINAAREEPDAAVLSFIDKGRLGQLVSDSEAETILKATRKMSDAALARFSAKSIPDQIKELVSCGYGDSLKLMTKYSSAQGLASLKPKSDNDINTVFGNNLTGFTGIVATGAKLLADGLATVMTATLDGCDYHQSPTYANKDNELGTAVGQVLHYFARKNRPVMIYTFSDGAVACSGQPDANGYIQPQSDNSDKAMSFAMIYDPAVATKGSRRAARDNGKGRQVGAFTSSGNVSTVGSNTLAGNVVLAGQVAVANYLALHGKEGDLAQYVGNDVASLDNYLLWQKIIG